ncbi:hypothetical protein ACIOYT_05445 [Streptomyces halstedii]
MRATALPAATAAGAATLVSPPQAVVGAQVTDNVHTFTATIGNGGR